jgi:Zn-dependent alcohol dehydrogenases
MRAMVLKKLCRLEDNTVPLAFTILPEPVPIENEILIKVSACGVCHTELDEIEGRTPPPHLPVVLGHQVVGRVEAKGTQANIYHINDRVGVPGLLQPVEPAHSAFPETRTFVRILKQPAGI